MSFKIRLVLSDTPASFYTEEGQDMFQFVKEQVFQFGTK